MNDLDPDLVKVVILATFLIFASVGLRIYLSYWEVKQAKRYLRHLKRERKKREGLLYEKN